MLARPIGTSRVSAPAATTLAIASIVFALGLAFASVELPRLVSAWMMAAFDFPGFDSGRHVAEADAWLSATGLRIVGYASLAVVVVAVVVGLVGDRRGLAAAGAVAVFLPVFGHFAASMFFLAGLGMLRVLALPILDWSHDLLALGDVAFLPYMAVVYPAAVLGLDLREVVIWGAMISGLALFVCGVMGWFLARSARPQVATGFIYRVSRHPQYLGWILWSWGLMLYVSRHSELYHFKISYGVPSSLPWLLSTMVIVGVALSEEHAMELRFGEAYREYAGRVPFLVPLPRAVRRTATVPMRLVLKTPRPRSGLDVLLVVAAYTAAGVLLSVPFVVFGWPAATGWYAFPYNLPPFVP